MIRIKDIDRLIVLSTVLLLAIGVVMVWSTSYIVAMKRYGDEYFFVKKHLTFALGGLICFIAATRIPYTFYRKMVYPILILSILFLICIYIPHLGFTAGGARRWIKLGPVAFQPSEPAKLAVIIFLAYSLSAKADKIKTFAIGFLPHIVIPGVPILLILFETDFGTAVTLSIVAMLMVFTAGVRLRYLAALGLAAVPFLILVVTRFSYMMNRVLVFLDPWKDPEGKGFQVIQSFLAFGSGGFQGVGLGEGKQKLFYLPEAHTDFILSVIGEELGLIGVGGVIMLYALFLYCGMTVALKAKDLYAKYLALGLTMMVVLQAAINMAVVMGMAPPKGLPLPLISYGGTSLMVTLIAVGIIFNICIKESEA